MSERRSIGIGTVAVAIFMVAVMVIGALMVFAGRTPAAGILPERSRDTYPPNPPVLESPRDGTKGITDEQVILVWRGVERYRGRADHMTIDNYWLKVSTQGPPNSDGAHGDVFDGQLGQTTSKTVFVEPGKKYYWAVKAHDLEGWSAWSQFASFSTNSPPDVDITQVDPSPARIGVPVSLKGTATDPDGNDITEYVWESNIEGELGKSASIKHTFTEVGEHTITFKAKDSNGVWSQPASFDLTIEDNNAPAQIKAITPTETHDLQPTLSWSEASDPEGDDVVYHISIGTSYEMPNDIVSDTVVEYNRYKVPVKLSYGEGGEPNTYYVSIYAEDEYGAAAKPAIFTLDVINHPPTAPIVTIVPEQPYSNNDLTVSLTKPSQDEDGDMTEDYWKDIYNYEIHWSVDNVKMNALDNQPYVPSYLTEPGQTWSVSIRATDGIDYGPATKAEIQILNMLPEVKITSPKNADGDDDGEADDNDGDGIPDEHFYENQTINLKADVQDNDGQALDYEWYFNGELIDSGSVGASTKKQTIKADEPLELPIEEDDEPYHTYELTLRVDDGMDVVEHTIIIATIPPSPEVSLSFGTGKIEGIIGEDTVGVSVTIKNTGKKTFKGGTVVFYAPDGSKLLEKDLRDLKSGKQTTASASYTIDTKSGSILVKVLDKDGNEIATKSITVIGEEPPPPPPKPTFGGALGKTPEQEQASIAGIVGVIIIILIVVLLALFIARRRRLEYYEHYYDEGDEEEEEEGYGPAMGEMYGMPGMGGYGMGSYGTGPYGMAGMGMAGQYPALGAGMGAEYGGMGMGGVPALPSAGMAGYQQMPGMMPQQMAEVPALPQPEQPVFKSKAPPQQPAGYEVGMAQPQAQPQAQPEVPLLPQGRETPSEAGMGEEMGAAQSTQPPQSFQPQGDMGAPMGEGVMTQPQGVAGTEPSGGETQGSEGEMGASGGEGELKCPYCGAPIEEGWLVCVNCKAMLK